MSMTAIKNLFRFRRADKGIHAGFSFRARTKSVQLTASEQELFESMFVPQFYARQAGLDEAVPTGEMFAHFLAEGIHRGLSPSPLFDPTEYRRQEEGIHPTVAGLPEIVRWCRTRNNTAIIPTALFDASFYSGEYPEVVEAGADPFEHFVRHGIREDRRPNGLFDPVFYNLVAPRQPSDSNLPSYAHYLVVGVNKGAAPSAILAPFLTRTAVDRAMALEGYDAVARAAERWVNALGADKANLLISLCHPYLYDGAGTLLEDATAVERLLHFLNHGIEQGIDPGPMFDAAYYKDLQARRTGASGAAIENALLHFIGGDSKSLGVPTPLFNEATYRASRVDMRDPSVWAFGHFLTAGIFEGHHINKKVRQNEWMPPLNTTAGQIQNWQMFWTDAGFPEPAEEFPQAARPISVARAAPKTHTGHLADHEIEFLKKLFVPCWYRSEAALAHSLPDEELFRHYLSIGIDANLSPGPLFDPQMATQLCNADPAKSAMKLWLANQKPNWPAPTQFLDVNFYRRAYPEFKDADLNFYEHYIAHGLHEGRMPNPLFDPRWYDQAYSRPEGEAHVPAYTHFLTFGANRGNCPSRGLLPSYGMVGEGAPPRLHDFMKIITAFQPISKRLSTERCFALLGFFVPPLYRGNGELGAEATGIERLLHFLRFGLAKGISPGPMFDKDYYVQSFSDRLFIDLRGESPFLNYLNKGWPKRLIPNKIFDEQRYRSLHSDIREQNVWGFQHFLIHGVFEGRQVDQSRTLAISPRANEPARSQLENWSLYWGRFSAMGATFNLTKGLLDQQRRLNTLLESPIFDDIVKRSQRLEPAIGEPNKIKEVYAAPHHDQLGVVMSTLLARMTTKTYHTIITVPWLRTGGADLVACQLASAIKEAYPAENVVILRADKENFERPDWLSDGIDHVLVSDVLDTISSDFAETALYAMILSIRPKRVINVNSLRIWRTFERYGSRLSQKVDLYAYLFCWDQTPDGARVGYPSMFYPATGPFLAATFTDTDYLRRELLDIYRPPVDVAERIVPLYTPSRTSPRTAPARQASAQNALRKRPMILWAGRLDRQKRFDLVQEIARRMPDADFLCWGDPLLDDPPDLTKSPPNLSLRPGFTSYEELPIHAADLWLFTSAWEGMPTILIELAIRGVSLVASQVGGVPELADEETSFPVKEVDDPDAYVRAIRFALEHPLLREERSRRLQQRATNRHSQREYVAKLKEIFDVEA